MRSIRSLIPPYSRWGGDEGEQGAQSYCFATSFYVSDPFPALVDGPEGHAKVRISIALHLLAYFPLLLPAFRSGLMDASAVRFFRIFDRSLHTDSSPFFIPSLHAERKRRGRRRLSCPRSNKDPPLRTNLPCKISRTPLVRQQPD